MISKIKGMLMASREVLIAVLTMHDDLPLLVNAKASLAFFILAGD